MLNLEELAFDEKSDITNRDVTSDGLLHMWFCLNVVDPPHGQALLGTWFSSQTNS